MANQFGCGIELFRKRSITNHKMSFGSPSFNLKILIKYFSNKIIFFFQVFLKLIPQYADEKYRFMA